MIWEGLPGARLLGAFGGSAVTSNGSVALLAGADRKLALRRAAGGLLLRLRVAEAVTHTLPDLLRQRIFGLALGYEVLDHDALRFDPALAAVLDKPGGTPAGRSTLTPPPPPPPPASSTTIRRPSSGFWWISLWKPANEPPTRGVIDLDAADDPLYGGHQPALPRLLRLLLLPNVFCGRHLLAARLRSSANDAADGAT